MPNTDKQMRDEGDDAKPAPAAAPAPNPALDALRARKGAVTVTEWATAKGMAPQFSTAPAGRSGKGKKLVPNPGWGRFRAAFFLHGWMENSERSETEFDAAVAKANDPAKNTFR